MAGLEVLPQELRDAIKALLSNTSSKPVTTEVQFLLESPQRGTRAKKRSRETSYSPDRQLNPKQRFSRAARLAVQDQVNSFRVSFFASQQRARCPITQMPISLQESHVDHIHPMTFEALIDRFLVSEFPKNKPLAKVEYVGGHFFDDPLQSRFADFHKEHALLRMVHPQANLSHLKKQANATTGSESKVSK